MADNGFFGIYMYMLIRTKIIMMVCFFGEFSLSQHCVLSFDHNLLLILGVMTIVYTFFIFWYCHSGNFTIFNSLRMTLSMLCLININVKLLKFNDLSFAIKET